VLLVIANPHEPKQELSRGLLRGLVEQTVGTLGRLRDGEANPAGAAITLDRQR
jgi:hypothetical protein